MPDLVITPVALSGGLNDSVSQPEPGDFQTLRDFTLYRGRIGLRAPLFLTATITIAGPDTIDGILAMAYHRGIIYVAVYNDGGNTVRLYNLTIDGATPTYVTDIWTGVTARPDVVVASFDGGSATAPLSRLYFADTNQVLPTVFLENGVGPIKNLTEDLNDDGTKENIVFSYIFPYNFHMFGAGFYAGTVARPELVRASQPGLIPAIEPNVVNNTTREWWFVDQLPVGVRGEPIISHGYAGESVIIFKKNRTYTMFGYDINSFTLKQLSDKVGAVGKRATCWTDDGICFFWSFRGLMMTDGTKIVDVSESVRNRIADIGTSSGIVLEYSPDDGQVYIFSPTGKQLAFDKLKNEYWEPAYVAASPLTAGSASGIPNVQLPPPSGDPSSLAGNAVSDSQIDITWTNGDTSLGVQTEVYVDAASPATTLYATVGSGVAAASITGLTSITTKFIRVRHKKNAQFSNYSNEINKRTWLKAVSGLVASSISTGVHLDFTNNEASSDLQIERKLTSGSTWTTINTLTNQTTGAKTYDDTTGVAGTSYDFRVLDKKTGEHDSVYSNVATAIAGSPQPHITTKFAEVLTGTDCVCPNVTISWNGTNFTALDTIKIYANDNGGGYTLFTTVAATDLSATYQWGSPPWKLDALGASKTLQFRLDLYDEGVTLIEQPTTVQYTKVVSACLGCQ